MNHNIINSIQGFQGKKTLKELSKDTSGPSTEYMTQSTLLATDFDSVKRDYANSFSHSENDVCSFDALIQSSDEILFIEFKNGEVKNANIRWKAYDSLLIFLDMCNYPVDLLRTHDSLIVVYNKTKNESSQVMSNKSIKRLAGEELIMFNLERFSGLFFKSVHTYNEEEFESYLSQTSFLQ